MGVGGIIRDGNYPFDRRPALETEKNSLRTEVTSKPTIHSNSNINKLPVSRVQISFLVRKLLLSRLPALPLPTFFGSNNNGLDWAGAGRRGAARGRGRPAFRR